MKNLTKRIHLLYLLAAPIVALITATLRTVALLTQYEPDIGRYASGTLSYAVAGILVAVSVALVILTHELRELFVAVPDYRELSGLFSGVFTAIALAFFAVTFPFDMAGQLPFILFMAVLASLLALSGACLFAYRAFRPDAIGGAPAMLALPLSLLALPVAMALSFTTTLRIADPTVSMATVALVAVAFFFLGEARIALGRAKWALHTCMTVLAAIAAATHALPNLIYHAVRGNALLNNTALDFVMLGFFLYTLSRLVATYAAAQREQRDATRVAMGTYVPQTTEAPKAPEAEEVPAPTPATEPEESTDEEDTDR